MDKKVFIIGNNKDYCDKVKEFIEQKGIATTLLLDYKDGIDKLFYEKPELTVLELTDQALSPGLIARIQGNSYFEIIDFVNDVEPNTDTNQIYIVQQESQLPVLEEYLSKYPTSTEPSESETEFDEEGNLEEVFFPKLIVDLYTKRKTGILEIHSATNLKICFMNGIPVFAEGGGIETALGKILLGRKKINEQEYIKAVDTSSQNKQKIGEVLVEMGKISPHELNNYLELQVAEKIIYGFTCLSGNYNFTNTAKFTDRIVVYQTKLPDVLRSAIDRYINPDTIELSSTEININEELRAKMMNELGLGPRELRLVDLLKQGAKFSDVLESSRLNRDETRKLIYFLSLLGFINMPDSFVEDIGRQSIQNVLKYYDQYTQTDQTPDLPLEEEIIELNEEIIDNNTEAVEQDNLEPTPETFEEGSQEIPIEDIAAQPESSMAPDDNEFEPEIAVETGDFEQTTDDAHHIPEYEENTVDIKLDLDEQADTAPTTERSLPQDVSGFSTDLNDLDLGIDDEESDEISIELGIDPDSADSTSETESDTLDPLKIETGTEQDDTPLENIDLETDITAEQNTAEVDLSLDIEVDSTQIEVETSPTPTNTDSEVIEGLSTEPGESPQIDIEIDTKSTNDVADLLGDDEPTIEIEDSTTEAEPTVDSEFINEVLEIHKTLTKVDHYQLLDISRDADTDQIRNSYYALVKKFHPDTHPGMDSEMRDKVEEIFTTITNAYETLSDEMKRDTYDASDEIADLQNNAMSYYDAEIAFKAGETFLNRRNYIEAERKFSEAVELNPEEPAYIGASAWAKYLAAKDKNTVKDDCSRLLEEAINANNNIAQNYYYLGTIYKNDDNTYKAEKQFEKAVELAPDFLEAKRELRLIQTRKQNKKQSMKDKKTEKRFWSSIFKK